MYRYWFVLAMLACSKSSPSEAPTATGSGSSVARSHAPAAPITSDEQVCDVLTVEEVSQVMTQPVIVKRLPKIGEYGAARCGWFVSDDADAVGVIVMMFYHPDAVDGPKYFHEKIARCENLSDDAGVPLKRQDPPKVGDEAAYCGALWVRKGNSFFAIEAHKPNPTKPWKDIVPVLAERIAAHLP